MSANGKLVVLWAALLFGGGTGVLAQHAFHNFLASEGSISFLLLIFYLCFGTLTLFMVCVVGSVILSFRRKP